jgi:hypothetical protein
LSFRTAYLTGRETGIWDLRRRNMSQSEIGRRLGISRQAVNKSLNLIDSKVEQAFNEAIEANNFEARSVNLVDGIMEAYSPVHRLPVFVSLSRVNGLKVWYMHEGECGSCKYEGSCRSYLENEAAERGIELSQVEWRLPPTQLAIKVFQRYLRDPGFGEKGKGAVEDACPFPPGIELPKKDSVGAFTISIRRVDWRVVAPVFSLGLILLVYSLLIPPPIPIMFPKEPEMWNQAIPQLTSTYHELENWTPRYSKQVLHDGDLLLNESERLVIENCTYILNGSMLVSDNASVVLNNAELWIKKHTSWSLGDIIPVGVDALFTKWSRLEVSNSSILAQSSVDISFIDSSNARIVGSNFNYSDIYMDQRSQILVDRSTVWNVGLWGNASLVAKESRICNLGPVSKDIWQQNVIPYTVRAEIYNSSIGKLFVKAYETSIEIQGDAKRGSPWSPSQFCEGGIWFNVTLYNSDYESLVLESFNSTVNIEDNRDIMDAWLLGGSLTLVNSSLARLGFGNIVATVSDSVVGYFGIHENTTGVISRSFLEDFHLHDFSGTLRLEQVRAIRFDGHDVDGTVLGDLDVTNSSKIDFWNPSKLTRSYEVQAIAEGNAIKGAALTLLNDKNVTVWEGETDDSGRAKFNLTYYRQWKLAPFTWADNNVTSTLTLTAKVGQTKLAQNVTVNISTPIVFRFDNAPDPSIWENKTLMMLSGSGFMVAAVGLITFNVFRKRGMREPYSRDKNIYARAVSFQLERSEEG